MSQSYRKIQKLLMAHIHERRTSKLWPSLHSPPQYLTSVKEDNICCRKSLATSGGSDHLLALATGKPVPKDEF